MQASQGMRGMPRVSLPDRKTIRLLNQTISQLLLSRPRPSSLLTTLTATRSPTRLEGYMHNTPASQPFSARDSHSWEKQWQKSCAIHLRTSPSRTYIYLDREHAGRRLIRTCTTCFYLLFYATTKTKTKVKFFSGDFGMNKRRGWRMLL